MDSVTQLALGAAVGEAVLGRKIGYRAALWDGLCGTIPDLDVFIPLADAVRDFTYHRSFSHSLFVLALLTPLLADVIVRIHKNTRGFKWRWYLLVYLTFAIIQSRKQMQLINGDIKFVVWPIGETIGPGYGIRFKQGFVLAIFTQRAIYLKYPTTRICPPRPRSSRASQ